MPIHSLNGLKAAKDKFNVALIVLDTMRVKNLSCYGYEKETTPNIDRVASEGVLFENHFAPGCWTLPSHVSMFTGLYPFTHRADMEHAYLLNEYPTWAEIARQLGYRPAAFNPNNWIQVAQAERGFSQYDDCMAPTGYTKGTHFTVERFEQWLANYRGDARPFFTFLNFGDPHLPCWPSDKNRARFLLDGVADEEARALDQNPTKRVAGLVDWSKRDFALLESLNDGCVADADDRVGSICAALEREGLLNSTMLIITSDHGDIFDEHPPQMAHTMNVYDACIHVPLIVRLPGVFEGGKRVESLVQNTDYLPTFLELAGASPHPALEPIQGISLVKSMGSEQREFAYAEDGFPWNELERFKAFENASDLRQFYRYLRTIRTHDYKYIYSSNGNDELYFVKVDKDEQNNLIEENPDVARELMQKMEAWLSDMPRRAVSPELNTTPGKPVTPQSKARMELWRGSVPRV